MTEWLKIVPLVLSCLSISIAVCAFLVGYRNFRLSRFPHARIVPDCFHRQSIKGPPDHYLEVEIESWGLPIYDLKVVLEVDFAENRRVNFRLAALGTVPNPTNAGQVVKFQLSGRAVKEALTKRSFESMGISDLPLGSVRIAVYGSGGREIRSLADKHFPCGWRDFDTRRLPTPQPDPSLVKVTEESQTVNFGG